MAENDSQAGALRDDGKPYSLGWWLLSAGRNRGDCICIAGNNRISLPDYNARNAERRLGCGGHSFHARGKIAILAVFGVWANRIVQVGATTSSLLFSPSLVVRPTRFCRGLQP